MNGENQRSVDIAKAAADAVEQIVEWDPPLVLWSGDVAERPGIPVRLMLFVRALLERLAGIRPDGSRRQVIVIAGNHDQPAHRREACFLELFAGIDGVTIVTRDLTWVEPDRTVPEPDGGLGGLSVCAVPHDTLKTLTVQGRLGEIAPRPGRTNILVAHGVAGGSRLYTRTIGREHPIPTDVLAQDWDYVALGHWHRPGPVSPGGTKADVGRVWYAGATENIGFGDVLDNDASRGWLAVTVRPGQLPQVRRQAVRGRKMHRLAHFDGGGSDPEQIAAALIANIAESRKKGDVDGAVIGQIVEGVPRDIWTLVDVGAIRAAASGSLHYEITVKPVTRDAAEQPAGQSGLGEIGAVLAERAQAILEPGVRDEALTLAASLVSAHLHEPVTVDPGGDTHDTAADGPDGPGTDVASPTDADDDSAGSASEKHASADNDSEEHAGSGEHGSPEDGHDHTRTRPGRERPDRERPGREQPGREQAA